MISISTQAFEKMSEDARKSFPDECCGFCFGSEDEDGNRKISEVLVVHNSKEGDKRKRFEISPKDYMKGEQYALELGLDFLGIYHSHPNHPAIPSEHDRVAAQPFFSYIIISVLDGKSVHYRSWRLNDDFQFEEEEIKSNQFQHN